MDRLKLLTLLTASVMVCGSFASCGGSKAQSSPNKTTSSVSGNSSQPESKPESQPDSQTGDSPDEKIYSAQSGDAVLITASGGWEVQYWGMADDALSYNAGVAHITGNGEYTVSVTADTNAFRERMRSDDYIPSGIEFLAVKIFDGMTKWKNMSVTINSVKVDGKELELTAKNYTFSEDGREMRTNIYNPHASGLPDDAHDENGSVSDDTVYNWNIVDPADFASWKNIEVDFTVSGIE